MAVLAPGIAAKQQSQSPVPFEADILKFEAEDAKNPPKKGGIVFVGSSSIVLWKTLKKDFPDHNVINRGFGGSQVSDSVRFAHRIVTPYEPKMVVFFAGTNDIAGGKSANTVFADYKAFVGKVREKLPSVPIAYISITPAPSRWDKVDVIRSANVQIETYAGEGKDLIFVNVFKQMLTPDGKPRPELFVEDQLHMNAKGYAIWKKAIEPILPKL
ncbi:MAG: hypothetical protein H7Y17_15175 [Chlorobia bacterium]|nr:hypothetical protein [Fimbriimonadaceae bacterium]